MPGGSFLVLLGGWPWLFTSLARDCFPVVSVTGGQSRGYLFLFY